MPTIFTNEYSRGPLYQYWKERNQEEKALREQRIEEAKLRSKGFRPMEPAFGPSSTDSYAHRAASGPPAYHPDTGAGAEGVEGSSLRQQQPQRESAGGGDELPSYGASTGGAAAERGADEPPSLLSAEEEKARLRQLEEQRRQIQSDSALAQTLSAEEEDPDEAAQAGKGKQPERRKSTAGKIGRWLADAASGYTKKQERW
ncbi:uncharacterized protein PV07_10967 [Cladophialophora immunda]|uniref:Uncharacterized protein n=1 Tax=Cladophialophora immunda TaxID=569365 RepID=A0A0D2ACW0_9EURO|nr:uncharacterized protein PV07_10967 [Cladophialophora immunda]KIW22697.1 hypothetical protein PV07_10967 [Cladophialophora immunda]OQU94113.1 hypothetical protein CLAIMM_00522 [Cladophialophora immunda]